MADNVELNSGTGGATLAADDIGGVHYPRGKVSLGADGTANDAIPVSNGLDTTGAGVIAAGVVGQFDDASTGAVTENQFAPIRISSRRALLVEGVASGTVIPVSDGGGALTVDGTVAVSGTVTVDGSAATQPISHAALTELAAAIDTEMQVDVVSSALPTGAATAANQSTANTALAAIQAAVELLDNAVRSEDEASATGHGGLVILAKRSDTPAATSGTDGDYEPVQVTGGRLAVQATVSGTVTVDGSGVTQPISHAALTELAAAISTEVQCDIVGALPAGDNNIGNVDIASALPAGDNNIGNVDLASAIPAGTNNIGDVDIAGGTVAHDAADSGNPVKIGAKAKSSIEGVTLVAADDRTDLYADLDGVLIVKPNVANGDIINERVSNTDGASTAFSNFGAVASTRNYIKTVVVHNAHATTMGYVDIRDGTAGTILATIPAPATGGAVVNFDPPLRSSANTAMAYDVSAAITTIYITATGWQSKA